MSEMKSFELLIHQGNDRWIDMGSYEKLAYEMDIELKKGMWDFGKIAMRKNLLGKLYGFHEKK